VEWTLTVRGHVSYLQSPDRSRNRRNPTTLWDRRILVHVFVTYTDAGTRVRKDIDVENMLHSTNVYCEPIVATGLSEAGRAYFESAVIRRY
jgi:hypothetical protein